MRLMSGGSVWRLDLSSGSELVGPGGELIALPYRKVGELLALLAANSGTMLDRRNLARGLWPDSSQPERQANLRQGLAKLRSLLGADAIHADRSWCGLDALVRIELTGAAPMQLHKQTETASDGPVAAFGRLVQWLAERDVPAMYAALRANPEYGIASLNTLETALEAASKHGPPDRADFGWSCFWRGEVSFQSNIGRAVSLLSEATEFAVADRDWHLLAHAAFWQGIGLLLLNRRQPARNVAQRAAAALSAPGGQMHRYRIDHLHATITLHEGRIAQALDQFSNLRGYSGQSTLEFASDEALRALYLAFNGRLDDASRVLDQVRSTIDDLECSRAMKYRNIAELVLAASSEGHRACTRLEDAASDFAESGDRHFEIYCRETLARCYWQGKAGSDARHQLQSSRVLRRRINMAYTGWDLARLGDMPALMAATR